MLKRSVDSDINGPPVSQLIKIDFSIDSDSKYNEDQEKKGLHFFIGRENVQNGEIQDDRQRT